MHSIAGSAPDGNPSSNEARAGSIIRGPMDASIIRGIHEHNLENLSRYHRSEHP